MHEPVWSAAAFTLINASPHEEVAPQQENLMNGPSSPSLPDAADLPDPTGNGTAPSVPLWKRPVPAYGVLLAVVVVVAAAASAGALVTQGNYEPALTAARLEVLDVEERLATVTGQRDQARETERSKTAEVRELRTRLEDMEASREELENAQAGLAEREAAVKGREDAVAITEERIAANSFGAGVHVVGTDIQPGTYRTDGSTDCYWARLANGGGGLGSILANGLPGGKVTVTIAPADWGFESQRCGIWTKVD